MSASPLALSNDEGGTICKESALPDEVRFARYGQHDHVPIPRHGKTERDKTSGAWGNRLANLVMRGDESRGGMKKRVRAT